MHSSGVLVVTQLCHAQISIAPAAPSPVTSRGFVHWRLSDAGHGASRVVVTGRHPKPSTISSIPGCSRRVRFAPHNDHSADIRDQQLRATSDSSYRRKWHLYSNTTLARASDADGMVNCLSENNAS